MTDVALRGQHRQRLSVLFNSGRWLRETLRSWALTHANMLLWAIVKADFRRPGVKLGAARQAEDFELSEGRKTLEA
jgi:hypothetical protein